MGILVISSDFENGRIRISQTSESKEDLDNFIAAYEAMYINHLLGITMATDFINDLVDRVPQSEKYLEIYNPFTKEIGDHMFTSLGMKEMIKGFIYVDFIAMQPIQNTPLGNVKNIAEVSEGIDNRIPSAVVYNQSVKTSDAIQYYIEDNSDTYPDFDGIHKEMTGIL